MLNKDSNSSGFNPKHRMIGAIVLVVAAVIIVPLVLNKRERPESIPEAQGPSTQTIVVPVTPNEVPPAEVAPATPPPVAMPSAPAPATPPTSAPAPAAPNTATAPAAKPAQPPAVTPPAKRPAVAKGWFVQAGTFSNPANARQLVERLKKKGFKASSESVRIEGNTVLRVQIGPFAKEGQAKEAQAALQRATDMKGLVRHY